MDLSLKLDLLQRLQQFIQKEQEKGRELHVSQTTNGGSGAMRGSGDYHGVHEKHLPGIEDAIKQVRCLGGGVGWGVGEVWGG